MGAIPKMKMTKKTRAAGVYNPDLDGCEWREVETDKYVFDETEEIAIAREYHERRMLRISSTTLKSVNQFHGKPVSEMN